MTVSDVIEGCFKIQYEIFIQNLISPLLICLVNNFIPGGGKTNFILGLDHISSQKFQELW